MKKYSIVILILLLQTANYLIAQNQVYPYYSTNKKILTMQGYRYYDWSANLKENLETMQAQRPYIDGVIFHNGNTYGQPLFAFNNEIWTEKSLRFDELTIIAKKWTKFTDNFIWIWGHSKNVDPDFFNDTLWTKIIKNTELLGKALKIADCKGIMFDAEFYSESSTYSPWWFTIPFNNPKHVGVPPYSAKTFDEVADKARQRGKEYVQALQVNMPKITILTTFLYSYIWAYCYDDMKKLPVSQYGLLGAFANGMLEGLNPGSTLIDGNETAYYVDETRKYFEYSDQMDYKFNRIDAPAKLCDSVVLKKWNEQGQVAMATYLDKCYNRYAPESWSTPDYQSKWMTHNIYNSLLASEQYVWVWMEGMDFWKAENAPPGVDVYKDIKDAVEKLRKGEALGYDMYKPDSVFKWRNDKQAIFITSPKNELKVSSNKTPGNISITATIQENVSISKVEFYANSLKIGEVLKAPYTMQKQFLKSDYLIFARIFKTNGEHFTSVPVTLKK